MATSYYDTAIDGLLGAFRQSNVATAAGIDPAVWASTTSPRVYSGDRGWIGGRHRGRLPLIEIFQEDDLHTELTIIGGLVQHRWTIRLYSGIVDVSAAESQLHSMMLTGLASLRQGQRWYVGGEVSTKLEAHPLGHKLECIVMTENTECRETFSVDLVPDPPTPTDEDMGMQKSFSPTTTSPLSVIVLTSDFAVDNVQLSIDTAFNVGATISVGTLADHEYFLAASEIDPLTAGVTVQKDFHERGPVTVYVFLTGVTVGTGTIQVATTEASN